MLGRIYGIEEHLIITFIASFLLWFMVGGLLYLWFYKRKMKSGQLVITFFCMFLAWYISEVLKKIFNVERPFLVSGQIPLTLTLPTDPSFPSAHASSAFALAISVRKTDRRLYLLYLIFAVFVALGRVLSHVHYIIDVIAGALIGITTVFLLEKLGLERLFRKILA